MTYVKWYFNGSLQDRRTVAKAEKLRKKCLADNPRFTKTVSGVDPWNLPNTHGVCAAKPSTKRWMRKEFHRAERRESRRIARTAE